VVSSSTTTSTTSVVTIRLTDRIRSTAGVRNRRSRISSTAPAATDPTADRLHLLIIRIMNPAEAPPEVYFTTSTTLPRCTPRSISTCTLTAEPNRVHPPVEEVAALPPSLTPWLRLLLPHPLLTSICIYRCRTVQRLRPPRHPAVTEEIVAGTIVTRPNLPSGPALHLSVPTTARPCTATPRPEADRCLPSDRAVRLPTEAKGAATARCRTR